MTQQELLGREAELAAIESLLDSVAQGPAVLALWGEAGIGKTMLWAAAADEARERGFAVLCSRPTSGEMRLSYSGLTDLLVELGNGSFDPLPAPQRRALEAALLRTDDDAPSPAPRAIAAGLLSLLDGLARSRAVLVAVDDIQWLDEPTWRVLDFAIRRCAGRIAVLVARRASGEPDSTIELCPRDSERRRAMRISPMSEAALHQMLRARLDFPLPRLTMHRIAEISGGNPFFALELARTLRPDEGDPGVLKLGRLPDSLASAADGRVSGLTPPVREALLVASALAAPRLELIQQALADDADAVALLTTAEDAGVVAMSRSGALRFTHPLLAASVYDEASGTARLSLHRRLSRLVDDPEERARHLALGAVGPDAEVVEALDAAATHARRRGAPVAAAELLELALELGADDAPRLINAAHDHYRAGNPDRARQLLERTLARIDRGPQRAEALFLLAVIGFEVAGDPASSELLEQALDEVGRSASLRFGITFELAYQLFNCGDLPAALSRMRDAATLAERLGDAGSLAEALAGVVNFRFLTGQGTDEATLGRALTLEDPERRSRAYGWPTLIAGLIHAWSFHLDEAHAAFRAVRERCMAHGFESEVMYASHSGISVACALGEIETAERYVNELVEQAEISNSDQSRAVARTFQAELWAWVGRVDDARAAATEALALLPRSGGVRYLAAAATAALGMAELSVGNAEEATRHLAAGLDAGRRLGIREPQALPFNRDLIDAFVEVGRLDDAEPLIEQLEGNGRRPDRLWSLAMGARGRGLLLAARDRPEAAASALAYALATLDRLPRLRYDRARTLLVLGRLQRRRNQRRAARASLAEAARLFEQIGAGQWARNARAALDRLGLRAGIGDQLTPTEQHIAALAASGLTNREIATLRFVSPKTVEAQLSRAYRKLGVRSRAQLAHLLAARDHTSSPTPS